MAMAEPLPGKSWGLLLHPFSLELDLYVTCFGQTFVGLEPGLGRGCTLLPQHQLFFTICSSPGPSLEGQTSFNMAPVTPRPTVPALLCPITYCLALSMGCTLLTSSMLHWPLLADAWYQKGYRALFQFPFLSLSLSFSSPSLAGFSWRKMASVL